MVDRITSNDREIMKTLSTIVIITALITLALVCPGCLVQQTTLPPVTEGVPTPSAPETAETLLPATQPVIAGTTIVPATRETVTDSLPRNVTDLPPATAVDIGIEKDRVYNTITVTFIGGPGQVLVNSILARVTTSDGLVQLKYFPITNQVANGASVDMKGTQGSDRVEVFVTLGGVTYKLKDQNMSYAYY